MCEDRAGVGAGAGARSVINLRYLTFGATMGLARPSCWRQAETETEAEMPKHVETFANARRVEGIMLAVLKSGMQLAKLWLELAMDVRYVWMCGYTDLWPCG